MNKRHLKTLRRRQYRPVNNVAGRPVALSPTRWVNFAANASGTHLDLYLYGVIGGYDWKNDDFQDAEQVITHLNEQSDLQTITVHINSLGGYVDEGLAILNTLRKHPAAVTVDIDAFALSIASVIMLAADVGKVRMARNAFVMIHNVSSGCWGNAADKRKAADLDEILEQSIVAEYVAKTGNTAESWQPLLDDETWFTAEQALDIGLIDEITGPVDLDEAADNISENIWTNMQDAELKHMPKEVRAQMMRRISPSAAKAAKPTANGAGIPAAPAATQDPASADPATNVADPAAIPAPAPATAPAAPAASTAQAPATNAGDPAASPAPAFNPEAERALMQAQMREAETARRESVTAIFANFGGVAGQHAEVATAALADMDCTPENAQTRLLEAIGSQSNSATGGSVAGDFNNGRIITDEVDTRRDQAVNALLTRGGRAQMNQGNPFAHMTLMDMARTCLNQASVNHVGMNPMEVAGRAFNQYQGTSDFPVILERTITEALLISYNEVANTWRRICSIGQVSDFRDHDRLSVGSIGTLDDYNESGEFKTKKVPDGEKAKIRAGTKGNIIAITREAIINDDLGYFMNQSRMVGNAAGNTIEALVYNLLLSNPTLSDGKKLFHASHNNLQTGAAYSETAFDTMAIAMGTQKAVGDEGDLAIDPSILLVPRKDRLKANKWMTNEFIPDGTQNSPETNGVQGLAETVGTSRISSGYYMFADPNVAPVLEVVFLNGVQEPYIEVQDGWRTDGAEMKIRLDVGVGATGYRGAQFNPGV